MRRSSPGAVALAFAVSCVAGWTTRAEGQQSPPAGSGTLPPEVGAMAPDFAVPGATRYGLLKNGVRLSDLRGQTVVLAFFVAARTRG
jgi:23S rRNA G2445 N2-methylase RlmL